MTIRLPALLSCLLLSSFSLSAAVLHWDFAQYPPGESPPGFKSLLSGQGQPAEWKIVLDDMPATFPSITPNASSVAKRAVLAQLSTDLTDERFPMLVYEEEEFGDFTLTTKIKNVAGLRERMGGIAFRIQDENNYYYIRISSIGDTFRFYKVVNGVRSAPIGTSTPIPSGEWHELTISCQGNRIKSSLNGKELIPELTDYSFLTGKIGYWTKSDSVSYFVDTKISYQPIVPQAQQIVHGAIKENPRLINLRIYARRDPSRPPTVIASNRPDEVGLDGGKTEEDVIANNNVYFGKDKKTVTVTLPMDDRNGNPVAAVRFVMDSFPGQTEKNAIARALPILKSMQARAIAADSIFE